MDYGILTEPQIGGTYDAHVRAARWCEQDGVVVFDRADHYTFGTSSRHTMDAFTSLAGLARDTETVRLCVLVSPITFRHPAVIIKSATTIDEMSGGRFMLGVGTGWMQQEHDAFGFDLWPMRERFARLEEALQFVRAALSADATGFSGDYYRLQDIDVLPTPMHLPIIVGGGGRRRTPTLAGRYADEYNQFGDAPEALAPKFDIFRGAAREAGRDPDGIVVSVVSQAYVGADEAAYRDVLGAAAAAREIEPAEFEDRLRSRNIILGTPDRAAALVDAWQALGVTRLYLQLIDPLDDIDFDALEEAFAIIRG
jgi:alkanesulfonate monooxygenase SsuD/methylene tetrahydromethanopterin reductase-like flavin-dependent oxidoreductase (luciferase family)